MAHCLRCGGALFPDGGDTFCLQCGWRGGPIIRKKIGLAVLERDSEEEIDKSPALDEITRVESGCELNDNCFTCTLLPDCMCPAKKVVDTPKARAHAIELKQQGYSPEQIAKEMHKSIRAVRRWVQ